MDKIIIGIHGLGNKPPKELLTEWWKRSIIEGFQVIHLPIKKFKFEMAYWAHHLHPEPQDPDIADANHPLYLPGPYVQGTHFGPREPAPFKKKMLCEIQKQILQLLAIKSGFMNTETISDMILHKLFYELEIYYHHNIRDADGVERLAKHLIRQDLAELLKKHRNKKIMLIAHSMGTIIAYDVLTKVVPDIPIHTLITMGSPLGFPVVLKKIREESGMNPSGEGMLPTPENITHHWFNFSDIEDVTCLNYNLRNNYRENSHNVRAFDQIVYCNYEYRGNNNPHKSYGYLRTADVTNAVNSFLEHGRDMVSPLKRIRCLGRMGVLGLRD